MRAENRSSNIPQKTVLLVLGMHRSGTSLLASLLAELGCSGPVTLMPANENNKNGYFESLPIYHLNDDILKEAGSYWNDWRSVNMRRISSSRKEYFKEKAKKIVKEEFLNNNIIYIKDPRICKLLPFWQTVLGELGFRILFINTHRNPVDVSASLHKRDEIDLGLGLLVWLRYVLEAENFSRGNKRFFTSYSEVLADPLKVANSINECFQILPLYSTENLERLVDTNLLHHRTSINETINDHKIPVMIRETLSIFEKWVLYGECSDDYVVLDKYFDYFNGTSELFSDPLNKLEEQARDLQCALLDANEAKEETEKVRTEYINSTSWKISAPVRLVGKLLRK